MENIFDSRRGQVSKKRNNWWELYRMIWTCHDSTFLIRKQNANEQIKSDHILLRDRALPKLAKYIVCRFQMPHSLCTWMSEETHGITNHEINRGELDWNRKKECLGEQSPSNGGLRCAWQFKHVLKTCSAESQALSNCWRIRWLNFSNRSMYKSTQDGIIDQLESGSWPHGISLYSS